VFFRASVEQGGTVTASNDTGFWAGSPSSLTAIATEGQVVPGTPAGTTFADFQLYVAGPRYQTSAGGGRLAFLANTRATGDTSLFGQQTTFIYNPGGRLDVIANTGAPRPDGGGNWAATGPFALNVNPAGRFVLRDGASVYTGTSAADLTLVARAGQTVAGRTVESVLGSGITPGGRVLFSADADPTVTDTRFVPFAAPAMNPGAAVRLLTPGDPAPGVTPATTFLRGHQPVANAAGEFVVTAQFAGGASAAVGLWKGNIGSPGTLTNVVVPGDAAPGAAGTTFSQVTRRGLSDSGRFVFTADLAGATITNANRSGLWTGRSAEDLRLLARQGDPVNLPGFAATVKWGGSFSNLATNASDQALIGMRLIGSGFDQALFGYDPSLGLVPLVKSGDVLEVSPGVARTVQSLTIGGDDFVVLAGATNEGSSVALNDAGEVAYRAVFTDGSQGIFKTRIPVAGDATFDGIVDTRDFNVLRAHLWQAGTRADGDFNSDGIVNFTDFQILERNFGRHPPVPAEALGNFRGAAAAAVPEPGTSGVVMTAATLGAVVRRRRRRMLTPG
jgi:hypothetical protein